MEFQTMRHDVSDGILTITLNRPEQLNAFTVAMAEELEHSFRAVNDDDSVRAVIVTGAGRAFCAGMDLSREGNVFGLDEELTPGLGDMVDLDDPAIAAVRDTGGRCTLAIHDCRKPVIAALNGAAVGIGATMTLAMDRRLMSASARIGLVFGRIGIVPEACSTWYLPRLVGPSAALDLVLRADILDAEAALAVGLVDEVHPGEDLMTRAVAVADSWTRGRSPVAVALSRQMVRRNGTLAHPSEAVIALVGFMSILYRCSAGSTYVAGAGSSYVGVTDSTSCSCDLPSRNLEAGAIRGARAGGMSFCLHPFIK